MPQTNEGKTVKKSIARFTVMPNGLVVGVSIKNEGLKAGRVYQITENQIAAALGDNAISILELGESDFKITEPMSVDKLLVVASGKHLTVNGK